ncbi:hypothetical protein QJQ45_018872, partial [Haematococcus lacustris]
ERLRSDPKDFAIMMAEANATPKPSRDRLVELLFEKLRVPAIFLAKNAVLSAFATARQTAVIVDAGYRSTTVAAVHDGYALTKTFAKSPFGGQALNTLMQKVEEVPSPLVTPSFKAYQDGLGCRPWCLARVLRGRLQVEALVSDIREALCKVNDVMFDEVANANLLTTSYELPDGTEIIVGSDRLKVPEVLFQPRLLSTFTLINPDTFTARPDGSVAAPLPAEVPLLDWLHWLHWATGLAATAYDGDDVWANAEMVMEAITKCDVDVRKDMYQHASKGRRITACLFLLRPLLTVADVWKILISQGVVLTGGLSLTGGLRDRLEKELTEQGPSGARFKVTMAANPTERRFSTWLGGSILASLGSFQQMWVSRKEYDEHGTPCPGPCPWWAQLPAQPWCACCPWLAGVCWALALRLQAVWLPGYCVGPVGACGGPLPGTTPGPALAGYAPSSRLGAAGAVPLALLGASSLQVLWH